MVLDVPLFLCPSLHRYMNCIRCLLHYRDLDQISYIYVRNQLKSDKKCYRGVVFNYVHYSTVDKISVLRILLYEYLKANVECNNQVHSNILSIESFLRKIKIIEYY